MLRKNAYIKGMKTPEVNAKLILLFNAGVLIPLIFALNFSDSHDMSAVLDMIFMCPYSGYHIKSRLWRWQGISQEDCFVIILKVRQTFDVISVVRMFQWYLFIVPILKCPLSWKTDEIFYLSSQRQGIWIFISVWNLADFTVDEVVSDIRAIVILLRNKLWL